MDAQFRLLCTVYLFFLPVLICATSSEMAMGQTASLPPGGEQVRGYLTDPAALAVSNAEVTTRNVLSGLSKATKTTTDGMLQFDGLNSGYYALTASAAGLVLTPHSVQVKAGKLLDAGDLRVSLVAAQEQVVVSVCRATELPNALTTGPITTAHSGSGRTIPFPSKNDDDVQLGLHKKEKWNVGSRKDACFA